MSKDNWNSQPKTPSLHRVELTNKVKIEMPESVEKKIKFLCNKMTKVEWSGILFYEVVGSFQKINSMKIILKDILLMDRGTKAYTEFDWDESVVEYQMENPEAMDWTIGHIHSHNDMDVFFSGTDWSELNDNSPLHNFYLSMIVNNYMELKAKIAFIGDQIKTYTVKDEKGKDFKLTITGGKEQEPVMFVYNCEFDYQTEEIVVPESFSSRFQEINEKAEKEAELEKQRLEAKQFAEREKAIKNKAAKFDNKGERKVFYDGFKEKNKGLTQIPDYSGKNHSNPLNEGLFRNLEDEITDDWDESEFSMATIEQQFATYVIRMGNDTVEDDELIEALEDVDLAGLNPESFADSIASTYGAWHTTFFDKLPQYHDDKAFMEVLEEVIGIYEEHSEDYTFLQPVVERLKEVGIKFENFITPEKTLV